MFIEAKDDGGGDDNWTTGAIRCAELQSNHSHQYTNIQFFYRPDALPVARKGIWHVNAECRYAGSGDLTGARCRFCTFHSFDCHHCHFSQTFPAVKIRNSDILVQVFPVFFLELGVKLK